MVKSGSSPGGKGPVGQGGIDPAGSVTTESLIQACPSGSGSAGPGVSEPAGPVRAAEVSPNHRSRELLSVELLTLLTETGAVPGSSQEAGSEVNRVQNMQIKSELRLVEQRCCAET